MVLNCLDLRDSFINLAILDVIYIKVQHLQNTVFQPSSIDALDNVDSHLNEIVSGVHVNGLCLIDAALVLSQVVLKVHTLAE